MRTASATATHRATRFTRDRRAVTPQAREACAQPRRSNRWLLRDWLDWRAPDYAKAQEREFNDEGLAAGFTRQPVKVERRKHLELDSSVRHNPENFVAPNGGIDANNDPEAGCANLEAKPGDVESPGLEEITRSCTLTHRQNSHVPPAAESNHGGEAQHRKYGRRRFGHDRNVARVKRVKLSAPEQGAAV